MVLGLQKQRFPNILDWEVDQMGKGIRNNAPKKSKY